MILIVPSVHAEILDRKVRCSLYELSKKPVISSTIDKTVEFDKVGRGIAVNIIQGKRFKSEVSIVADGTTHVTIEDGGDKIVKMNFFADLTKDSLIDTSASTNTIDSFAMLSCSLVD